MRRPTPAVIAAVVLGLVALLLLVTYLSRRGDSEQDKLGDDQLASAEAGSAAKCGSQRTYELIKREIFRQAADTRGSDTAAFDRVAAGAAVRMDRPVVKGRDEDAGLLRCAGTLSIDLPPGLSVVGGRRTLSSPVEYTVQPAADGSGDVVLVRGADSIIVPLATLASVRSPEMPSPATPVEPATDAGPIAQETPSPLPTAQAAPPQAPSQPTARPSFNCRLARTRGEIAVCRDQGLAALDRQMAAQFRRATSVAGPRQLAVLRATRDSFLRYRDRCQSDACIAGAYRDRMREIDDIMTGRWRPGQ